jgi:hypothetical protein
VYDSHIWQQGIYGIDSQLCEEWCSTSFNTQDGFIIQGSTKNTHLPYLQALIQKTNKTHEENYSQGRNIRTVLILYLTEDKTYSQLNKLLNPPRKHGRQNNRRDGSFMKVEFKLGMVIPAGNIVEYNKWGGNFSEKERLIVKEINSGEYSIQDLTRIIMNSPLSPCTLHLYLFLFTMQTPVRQIRFLEMKS